jgi:hypothetical protein
LAVRRTKNGRHVILSFLRIFVCGAPEAIAACDASHTGRFLADLLRKL